MVADTYSTTLGVLLMGTGNDNNSWGSNANASVFQILEDAIVNALTSTVAGGTLDLSGTPPPAAATQVRYAALIFNGTLASNQVIQVPNLIKSWWVQNATNGSFTLKIKTPAGTASTAIPQNSGWQLVMCDGANGITVSPFNTVQVQMPNGSAAAPAYSFINGPSSGWYRNGTEDYRFAISGADILQVTGPLASTPSVFNVLSPNALQVAGAQVLPAGVEMPYAGVALPSGGWLWEDGTAYSRTTYATLFAAITQGSVTGNTHTNTTLDNLSVDMTKRGLVGAYVEGTGIPTGTTITALTSTTITLSQAAISTTVGITLRILPHGQGDGSTTFNVPDRREYALIGRGDMNASSDPGRITLANAGFNPISLSGRGGVETNTLTATNLPAQTPAGTVAITDPGHSHTTNAGQATGFTVAGGGIGAPSTTTAVVNSNTTGITASFTGTAMAGQNSTPFSNVQPTGVTNFIIKT